MPKIVIFRGNSGSGKSTVSTALQKKLGRGTFVVSQDLVRRQMLWVQDLPGNQTINLLKNLIEYGHQHCAVTVLDGILYSDIYQSLFERIVQLYGDSIFAYYFDLPFEETIKRHEQRPQSREFGEIRMKQWWREKDFLKNIPEKVIHKEMPMEEIVEMVYLDIQNG